MKHEITRFMIVASACILTASCQEPGYRTEVSTGEQGRTQVHQVPYAQPPAAATGSPDVTIAPARNSTSPDSDLGTVESLWSRLSPEDRKRVADMARRLAPAQP
jgi:hypothetical protein